MLLLVATVHAHGTLYATSGLTSPPGDDTELWALAGGWGLVHSTDDGASWEWWCEEAFDVGTIYGVAASGPADIVLATNTGLYRVMAGGDPVAYTGLPVDAQVGGVIRFGEVVLADVVSVEDVDGLYLCAAGGCTATDLVEDGRYVQSMHVDGDTAWIVTRYASTLHSMLYRSTDGATWTLVHDWDDGSESRTLLDVDGDTLWAWALPRDTEAVPWMERSDDGGASFSTVWTSTNPTQELPQLARVGGSALLSDNLGRTWRTDDDGASWSDVSDTMPMMRCTQYTEAGVRICADHFADGFDFARLTAVDAWEAFGCMDQAEVADPVCDEYVAAYQEAGLYGGGDCDASYTPPVEQQEPPCGCAGESSAAFLLFGLLARRRR